MNFKKFRRRIKIRLSWLIGLSLLLAGIGFLIWGPVFRLRYLFCQINTDPCPQSVWDQLRPLRGHHALLFNRTALTKILVATQPEYAQILISTTLPDQLRVEINLPQPIAQLRSGPNAVPVLIDAAGKILGPAGGEIVPTIYTATPSAAGLTAATSLITALQQAYIPFMSLTLTADHVFEVQLTPDLLVRFSDLKDFTVQVSSLQLILPQATISPKPRIIDVRFNKPVLTY